MKVQAWWADMPTEQLRESAWERQMGVAGMEAFEQSRYRANGTQKEASETSAGQKLMRKLLTRATEAIEKMQAEIIDRHRVERAVKGTVLMVPADTCAVIALKIILDRTFTIINGTDGFSFQTICKEVAKGIELELNFRNWVRKSKESAKAYAEAQGYKSVPKSMAERLIEDEGRDRQSIWRWKKAFAELNEFKWDNLAQHYCGDALVTTVVEALPDCFVFVSEMRRGKAMKYVRMTPELRKTFEEMETRMARLQVIKKPMLSRPRPWRKED
ncbi:hypothetical protein Q9295_10000 [Xinfangfangia sp. CPCC 101601]|uniref:Uncharacterized protein n=1 Tax=Pseudogemmobacter lacusdianii TaxID=3069608 RepID=A0ABU0VY74_9RHOB|nr:hypothetical protein [Xinfangfangia sp. CPCC 101601]MDQ2066709.1 hypothetical protein [Xinfangfangia sp. CPCC 101601]